jgi:glycosyltransferase involved in cell wall biosynthesis
VGGYARDDHLDKASYILAESLEQADQYFSAYKDKVDLLPQAIDTDLFIPNKGKKAYDIVNVGRFISLKNQEASIPFFKHYKIALVGAGPTWKKISKKAHPYKDHVYMPKQLFGTDLLDVISKSSLMVHPSLSEGIPRVFIEAMSCGVPVVALSKTIKGIVENGGNGYLIDEEDLISFTRTILGDKKQIDKIGKRCRDYAIKYVGKNSTVPVLNKMYEKTL